MAAFARSRNRFALVARADRAPVAQFGSDRDGFVWDGMGFRPSIPWTGPDPRRVGGSAGGGTLFCLAGNFGRDFVDIRGWGLMGSSALMGLLLFLGYRVLGSVRRSVRFGAGF